MAPNSNLNSIKDDVVMRPKTPIYMQLILGLISNLPVISPGMSLGFSAIALPTLTSISNPTRLTPEQASWFASVASIAMPLGCFLSGPIIDRMGRKFALYTINIVTLIGWTIISLTNSSNADQQYPQLLIGRFITGIGSGLCSVPATVYMSEISTPKLRGMVCTFSSIAFALGVLIVYILGYILKDEWKLISVISAIIPLISIVLIRLFLMESPVWYQNKGRYQKAENTIRKLQGFGKARLVLKQTSMLTTINEVSEQSIALNEKQPTITIVPTQTPTSDIYKDTCLPINIAQNSFKNKLLEKISYFAEPECYKPFLIMTGFFFFQQCAGIFVIVYYAVDIVQEAGIEIDPYVAAIMIGLIRFIVALMISYISKKFGRRPPSIASGSLMTISMIVLAIYLYLINAKDDVIFENSEQFNQTSLTNNTTIIGNNFKWIPLLSLLLYFCASTFGFLTLPFAMLGEVYPAKVRGVGGGLTTCLAYTISFIVVKLYPSMLHTFGRPGLFLFYSVMSFLGTVFVIIFLPETKGKTLQEIEAYFRGDVSIYSESNIPQENDRQLIKDDV